jgi:heme/copper-type cytochrome/quinol oxidase subunit 2
MKGRTNMDQAKGAKIDWTIQVLKWVIGFLVALLVFEVGDMVYINHKLANNPQNGHFDVNGNCKVRVTHMDKTMHIELDCQ